MIFRWQNLPYGGKGEFVDVKGGRLMVRREHGARRYATVRWNTQEIGSAPTVAEGKALAERLYGEGNL